jgi:hypothetical protein
MTINTTNKNNKTAIFVKKKTGVLWRTSRNLLPSEQIVDFIVFSKLTYGCNTAKPGHENSDGQSERLYSMQEDILSASLKNDISFT